MEAEFCIETLVTTHRLYCIITQTTVVRLVIISEVLCHPLLISLQQIRNYRGAGLRVGRSAIRFPEWVRDFSSNRSDRL